MPKVFSAVSIYGICTYREYSDGTLKGSIEFFDLQGKGPDRSPVSAVHIHSAATGNPILVWLATSHEWENGVAQAAPLANAPCCVPGKKTTNPTCSLQSPSGTPLTKCSSFSKYSFCISKPVDCEGESCPWTREGTLLNFHGYQFQTVINGCPTKGTPGADLLVSVPFVSL